MVAVMTGVNALGKGGPSRTGRPAARRSISCCSPNRRCSAGRRRRTATMFGSLQLAADVRSDRDEVAPRVLSYKAPIAGTDVFQRRQPQYAETSPLNVFNRIFGGTLPTGTDPAEGSRAEALGLRFHAQGHRSPADADPREREGPARLAAHLDHAARGELARRCTAVDAEHRRLHQAGHAADVRQHQLGQADDGTSRHVYTTGLRRRLLRRAARPTATLTSSSGSTSSA